MADVFTLRIQIEIERRDENYGGTGERLSVREEQLLTLDSFAETASVLGRFHDLSNAVKRERAGEDSAETGLK